MPKVLSANTATQDHIDTLDDLVRRVTHLLSQDPYKGPDSPVFNAPDDDREKMKLYAINALIHMVEITKEQRRIADKLHKLNAVMRNKMSNFSVDSK